VEKYLPVSCLQLNSSLAVHPSAIASKKLLLPALQDNSTMILGNYVTVAVNENEMKPQIVARDVKTVHGLQLLYFLTPVILFKCC